MVYFRKTRDAVSKLTTPGHIYFIQAESGGLVKIGWATCPKTRMARMQAHGPLKLVLLHSEPGNGKDEAALHRQFAVDRRHGEWFEPTAGILAHIEGRRGATVQPYAPAPAETYVLRGRKPPPPGRPRGTPSPEPEEDQWVTKGPEGRGFRPPLNRTPRRVFTLEELRDAARALE